MESKEQDRALQAPSEANRDKHMNYLGSQDTDANSGEDLETRRKKQDTDSGSDGTSNEILQKENLIDSGNEHHHHRTDTDKRDITRSARHDADAGGDASSTAGPEQGEGKNDEPDTSGEDG